VDVCPTPIKSLADVFQNRLKYKRLLNQWPTKEDTIKGLIMATKSMN